MTGLTILLHPDRASIIPNVWPRDDMQHVVERFVPGLITDGRI